MGLFRSKKNPGGAQSDQNLSSEFILAAIEDGVVMVGGDNILHLFNHAASKISSWQVNEALGLDYRSVLKLTDGLGRPLPEDRNPFTKVLISKQTLRNDKIMLKTLNNKLIPISLIVSPVAGKDESNSVVGVFRDITTEKVEEQQRSEFVSTASHEMRTPIAAIEGYLALTLNPKVTRIDDRAREYINKAHETTQHLSQLFSDLLTSSKADDGRISSHPEVIELGEVVQQIAESARFTTQKKGLTLDYKVSGNQGFGNHKTVRPLFYVHVDPDRLREVLQNLVDNAIKYTAEGWITISLTGTLNTAQIQVQDTGQGIAEEDIPHLFQKFYRVDNSMTRSVSGTGLGLFICRKILDLYNGQIWVESQVGHGSTFFISLPRLSAEQALKLQRKEALTISPLDASSGNRP